MTEPYDKAAAGQPITALRWNNLQTQIRDEIEDLKANKLQITGGTVTGALVVNRTAEINKDPLHLRGAGNAGLRIETGATANDIAAVRFQHADASTGWIATWLNGRMTFSGQMHLLSGRLGIGIDTPQQELHVRGRVMLDGGVIQTPGPSIVNTGDLGLYSQIPGQHVRVVTRDAPIRFFSDGNAGTTSNVDIVPGGDLKVRRSIGVGVPDSPADLVHLFAATGNIGIRLQNGVGPNDWNVLRFVHGNAERAWLGTHGATGRFTVGNTINVLGGRVGIGTGTDTAIASTLDVRGDLIVGRVNSPGGLLLNNQHVGFSNGTRDRAEISVDPGAKTLMIVGSISGAQDDPTIAWPGLGRRVSLWDRLEVNGHVLSQTLVAGPLPPSFKPVQAIHTTAIAVENGIIQRGGGTLGGTADLGLYSQVANNWIRIVTNNGLVTFRSDGGIGSVSNVDIQPTGDLKVRRWVSAAGVGVGIDAPADLLHIKGAGNVGLRIEATAGGTDQAVVRFFHGATQSGYLYTNNSGRFSVNDAVFVLGQSLGIGTTPNANLHVRTAAGLTSLRVEAGTAAGDTALLQFFQGGQRAALYTNNAGLTVDSSALVINAPTIVNSTLTVKNGAITPAIGNSANAGIQFPINPGGGGGDEAFIRYHVEAAETTTFRLGVNNDPDDSLRLFQYGADRLIIQNGQVTIGQTSTPYTVTDSRMLNVEGEIKSFGGGSGLRMSDRSAAATGVRDWVMFPDGQRLNFWQGEVGVTAFLSSTRATVLNTTNPINFTSVWSGTPDPVNNQAEISNDISGYKTLMIIGNKSSGLGRRVSVWDRLDVNGQAFVNGAVVLASDRSLKSDIEPLRGALSRALELRPVSFTWTKSGARDIGLIAQEAEHVVPELVTTNETAELGQAPVQVKGLQYNGVAVIAVAAVQELAREVASLRRELAELRERTA